MLMRRVTVCRLKDHLLQALDRPVANHGPLLGEGAEANYGEGK